MNDGALVKTGIIGAVIAAVCCFTPVLAILLAMVGLSALTGYLDYVLFPALALFIALIGYGVYKQRQRAAEAVVKTTMRT